jgi:ubiquinone/menaquinone biosynthesis C-methylase UbiE
MSPPKPPPEVIRYYEAFDEARRLELDYFPLERERTQEIVARHLPPAPAVVLDVGGAAGAYSYWLAGRGYEVHLVDPVSRHIRQAREAAASQRAELASASVGDARSLGRKDASTDAVLLLGPLYHLQDRGDRLAALREARRVLRPGGWLFAAAISRYASLLDGLRTGKIFDEPAFAAIVERDLESGRHVNETGQIGFFTTAFFHRPDDLAAETAEAGFEAPAVHALEGPGAFLPDFARRWNDPARREILLRFLARVEREPALLGASPHLLAVARRPPNHARSGDETSERRARPRRARR